MAASSDVVKQGYVKIPSKKLGVWKKRWLVVRKRSSSGQARLEKYKHESCFVDVGVSFAEATVLELRYVKGVARLKESTRKYGVYVIDHVREFHFAADSEVDANCWVTAIKDAIAEASKSQNSYKVHLMRDMKLKFYGECTLFVASDCIRILDIKYKNEIVSWPFSTLRKYGVEKNHFQIESGRSSETGEGIFNFAAEDPEAIYQCVHDAARSQVNRTREQNSRQVQHSLNTFHTSCVYIHSEFDDIRSSNNNIGRDYHEDNHRNDFLSSTRTASGAAARQPSTNNYTQDRVGENYREKSMNNEPSSPNYKDNRIKSNQSENGWNSMSNNHSQSNNQRSPYYSRSEVGDIDSVSCYDNKSVSGLEKSYVYADRPTLSSQSSTSSQGSAGRKVSDDSGSDISNRPLPIPGNYKSSRNSNSSSSKY